MDDAWVKALDSLEIDISAAERLVATREVAEIAPWVAPTPASPFPTELQARGLELLRRQQAILTTVAEATRQAQRQLAVTDRIGRATRRTGTRPIYIDTSA